MSNTDIMREAINKYIGEKFSEYMDINDDGTAIQLDGRYTKLELEIIAKHMEDEK